ncbi:hypothetical protein D5086_011969 [Populus alba]|uniref:Smr domain-containing protein n=2 Tax=Populus alba TaxID=43335 RepID=A0A4U5QKM7_POPAL|nr:pentatricopeptide repeat-containing protein At4g16390, chloroplastic-like isoform X1 [Populus alba]TKS09717.1 hypothetical protein D5086_0000088180 [Populus alba]
MASNLCSSPSSLYKRLCNISSSSSRDSKSRNLNNNFYHSSKINTLSSQSRATSLQITNVSLQDEEIPRQETSKDSNFKEKTGSSSKSYIWVNPESSRASILRKSSYDAKYTSLVNAAKYLNSCSPNKDDVFNVLSELDGKLLEQDAVVILNNMSNPDTALLALKYFQERLKFNREVVVYNVTLKVFRKGRDLDKAEKLFDEMLERGVKPDNFTFSTIISCARLCNLADKAVEWFEKMPSFGLEPDDVTFSTMIDSYGRAGNVEKALSLYDRARTGEWRLDATTFSTLIRIYKVAGNFDGCLNVYEEMKALGVKPNLVTYNILLDAMGRAKRPWQVKKFFQDIIDNGLSPSFVTYAALLHAYGRARYGDDAFKIYKEMKEKGLGLNVVLYNSILAMCADLGHVDKAVEIFEDMKSSGIKPDSWTFSSMITIFSCCGKVSEAENTLNEMFEAGFQPNIFILTSLIQCYGKAQLIDDVVKTFNRIFELIITPDDRFCGCLLNVMTQTPNEELSKLVKCVERANPKLGIVVKLLVEEQDSGGDFKNEATDLFDSISTEVKKAYCNCLIDLCIKLNMLERACELLDLGLTLEIHTNIMSRTSTQWSLNLKSLSPGAAMTALHIWMNDLSKVLEAGEQLPPLLGINTGHGKHKYSEKGLANVFESYLKELNSPFHEAPDKVGWFLTTKVAAESWLESRKSTDAVAA